MGSRSRTRWWAGTVRQDDQPPVLPTAKLPTGALARVVRHHLHPGRSLRPRPRRPPERSNCVEACPEVDAAVLQVTAVGQLGGLVRVHPCRVGVGGGGDVDRALRWAGLGLGWAGLGLGWAGLGPGCAGARSAERMPMSRRGRGGGRPPRRRGNWSRRAGTPAAGAVIVCSSLAPSRLLTVPSTCPCATGSPGPTDGSHQPSSAQRTHRKRRRWAGPGLPSGAGGPVMPSTARIRSRPRTCASTAARSTRPHPPASAMIAGIPLRPRPRWWNRRPPGRAPAPGGSRSRARTRWPARAPWPRRGPCRTARTAPAPQPCRRCARRPGRRSPRSAG